MLLLLPSTNKVKQTKTHRHLFAMCINIYTRTLSHTHLIFSFRISHQIRLGQKLLKFLIPMHVRQHQSSFKRTVTIVIHRRSQLNGAAGVRVDSARGRGDTLHRLMNLARVTSPVLARLPCVLPSLIIPNLFYTLAQGIKILPRIVLPILKDI